MRVKSDKKFRSGCVLVSILVVLLAVASISVALIVAAENVPQPATGHSRKSRDPEAIKQNLCKAIEEFIHKVDYIAYNIPSRALRKKLYGSALTDLILVARYFYGPICPCDEIEKRAIAHQRRVERFRSPPPGWDPADEERMKSQSDITGENLRVLQRLTALCH